VTVGITVLVPRGAQGELSTGNGAVSVERVGGDVQASSGNGAWNVDGDRRRRAGEHGQRRRDASWARRVAVRVSTGNGRVNVTTSEGPVEGPHWHGDIDVSMTQLKANDDMTFSTAAAACAVTLPSATTASSMRRRRNGELRSDFDLKIQGRMNPRHIRATIGDGWPRLRLTTGQWSIGGSEGQLEEDRRTG
jgi:hypothetical protein